MAGRRGPAAGSGPPHRARVSRKASDNAASMSPMVRYTARQEAPSPVPERLSAFAAQRQEAGLSPWLWLGLAVAFGGLALILQRRLRAR